MSATRQMKKFNCKNSTDGKTVVCSSAPKAAVTKPKVTAAHSKRAVTARKCKRDCGPAICVEGLTVEGTLTTEQLNATMAKIQDVFGCLIRTHTSILGEVRTDLRDQFRVTDLVDLMNKVVSAYFSNDRDVFLTIPDFSWTGQDPIPTQTNLPKKTINVSELTADDLLEIVLSLGALIYYENEDLGRLGYLSTDILNTGFPGQGDQAASTQAGIIVTQLLLDRINSGELTGQDITRELGIRLMNSYFKTLYNFYVNPLYFFQSSWTQLYSAVSHKYYNLFFNADSSSYLSDYMSFSWNISLLQFTDPAETGVNADRIRLLPKLLMSDVRSMKKVIEYERAGIDTYFWVKLFVDPLNSRVTDEPFDVEGVPRPEALTETGTEPYLTEVVYPDFIAKIGDDQTDTLAVPFRQLRALDNEGSVHLSYKDIPDDGLYGLETLIKYPLGEEEGEKLICEVATIWDNLLIPLFKEYRQVLQERADQAQDQDYMGAWRAKIPVVELVNRDAEGFAESYVIPLNGVSVAVPRDPATNTASARSQAAATGINQQTLLNFFRKTQGDIAEMDKWLLDSLENAMDAHEGDDFLLLRKRNLDRNILSGNPYASIDDIFANYSSETQEVDNSVDGRTLADLTYRSGLALNDFFYDIKEYLANIHVKNNFAQYGFSTEAAAGLLRINNAGQVITYQQVVADVQAATLDNLSDLQVIGRHYGYTVNGDIVPGEWIVPGVTLRYTFQEFDYIYRQHYAIDTNAPLTPQNRFDPVTGKEYYQYTDPGDEERRNAFVSAFAAFETTTGSQIRAGKLGSYNRWKFDYEFQKIAKYVIDTAAEKGLLPPEFVDRYYTPYIVDTNDPPPVAPDIRLTFRIRGGITSAVNAGMNVNRAQRFIQVTVLFPTLNPAGESSMRANLGIILHEGALGHGFDNVPNAIDTILGVPIEVSWLTNVNNSYGFYDENFFLTTPNLGPGLTTLGEGWATFGEILGIQFGYYFLVFNAAGEIEVDETNIIPALYGMITLSRIAARQVVAIGLNFSKYAWTFYRMVNTFEEMSNIPINDSRGFHQRFVLHPMQQTPYAAGLITNLALVGLLTEQVEAAGCEFDLAKFIEFRILRTDYILGATLLEIAQRELDTFKKNCP